MNRIQDDQFVHSAARYWDELCRADDERKACIALEIERATYRAAMRTAEAELERTDMEIKIRGLTRGTAHLRVRRLRLCQAISALDELSHSLGTPINE